MTSSWHWVTPKEGDPLIPLLCAWLASFSYIPVFPPFQPHFPTKELRIQTQVFTVNGEGPRMVVELGGYTHLCPEPNWVSTTLQRKPPEQPATDQPGRSLLPKG